MLLSEEVQPFFVMKKAYVGDCIFIAYGIILSKFYKEFNLYNNIT